MSAENYLSCVSKIISAIQQTQETNIEQAAEAFSRSIRAGGRVYLFGSGHSVIPVMDIFRAMAASWGSSRCTIRA